MKAGYIFSLAFLLAVGCNHPRKINSLTSDAQPATAVAGRQISASAEPSPADDGRQVFLANCTGCHGKNADGDTPAGRVWHAPNLRSPKVQTLADAQLLEVIRGGKGKMPAWGGLLSQLEIEHLLAYVRSLR